MSDTLTTTIKVVKNCYCYGDDVTPDSRLVDDLEFDSLDRVELEMAVSDEFNVEVPDGHFDKSETVTDVAAAIDALLAGK